MIIMMLSMGADHIATFKKSYYNEWGTQADLLNITNKEVSEWLKQFHDFIYYSFNVAFDYDEDSDCDDSGIAEHTAHVEIKVEFDWKLEDI